jgi:hypothetical protein
MPDVDLARYRVVGRGRHVEASHRSSESVVFDRKAIKTLGGPDAIREIISDPCPNGSQRVHALRRLRTISLLERAFGNGAYWRLGLRPPQIAFAHVAPAVASLNVTWRSVRNLANRKGGIAVLVVDRMWKAWSRSPMTAM